MSRNPCSPPQADDVYEEDYVINNTIQHYKFVTKYSCLSNHFNQSQSNTSNTSPHKTNNRPKQRKTSAIDCLTASPNSHVKFNNNTEMDAKTINNLELAYPFAETGNPFPRYRDIVKPGFHRQSGGRRKKYHEPKCIKNDRRIIEERLQQVMQRLEHRKTPQTDASNHKHRDGNNGQSTHFGK